VVSELLSLFQYIQKVSLEHINNSIEVEVDVTNIPAFLMLSMEGMVAGDSRYAADVVIPDGVKLISDPKMSVVHLSVKAAEEEVVVAAPVEGEAGAAPAAEGDAAATAAAPAAPEADKKDDKKDKKK